MRHIAAIGLLAALAGCAGDDPQLSRVTACKAEQGMSLMNPGPGWGWGAAFGLVGELIRTQDPDYLRYAVALDECLGRKAREART